MLLKFWAKQGMHSIQTSLNKMIYCSYSYSSKELSSMSFLGKQDADALQFLNHVMLVEETQEFLWMTAFKNCHTLRVKQILLNFFPTFFLLFCILLILLQKLKKNFYYYGFCGFLHTSVFQAVRARMGKRFVCVQTAP